MSTDTANAAAMPRSAAAPGPVPAAAPDGAYGLGLQLARAGMLALTRLQLAIQSGDRQQAMAALDRLHALDAELESLVARLPAPPPGADAEWEAVARQLADQKLAIAFEKLALASDVSGPDLVSPPPRPEAPPRRPVEDVPPLPQWPELPEVEPTVWRLRRGAVIALLLALLVAAALTAAAVLTSAA